MEFINKLVEDESSVKFSKLRKFDEDFTFRSFRRIPINDLLGLSIQASYGHYCNPRKTIKDLSEYTRMEFALLDSKGEFVAVTDVLPSFSRLNEIEEYHDTVYGYVPVELIEELYQELTKSL
ncbi:hypothetical protein [Psychrobacillus phage Perkons]|nr:hypothetical protein [Psychrobacillus phage Perkons]